MREQATVLLLAQKEAALSAREQAEYSSLLKEDFFSKRDFGRLEHFYAHAWDRLSEEGKVQMSHRVWEGVRRGEYHFSDLPKDVRDKEEDRIFAKISDPVKAHDSMGQIPESDRADFIRAYNSGDREETAQVLNRECFGKNTALSTTAGVKHEIADEGKKADNQAVVESVRNSTGKAMESAGGSTASAQFQDIQLDTSNLKNVTLVDTDSPPSPRLAAGRHRLSRQCARISYFAAV